MTPSPPADPLVGQTITDAVLDEKLLTEKNHEVTLRSILSGLPSTYKGIVIFLFPAVDTPYCTDQACRFSTSNDMFKQRGYEVYGMTSSRPGSAENWAKRNRLSYSILLDDKWNVIKYLQCTWMKFIINRSHVVIGRDAKILAIERGVNAAKSSDRALEIINGL
ncbi:hypothetical protein BgAZ_401060 [Babesia gibsoni]|uniref:thioredoxin-dependent peroxiredoxin n=1 Tax=Babesia gibsoni TaxID=33632 RepID=A0AAD8LNM9_BABGI|nr:hypothetical protein BgAZ_401060 [Babesia gibsoni]